MCSRVSGHCISAIPKQPVRPLPLCYTKTTCQATAFLLYQNNLSGHCISAIPKQPVRPLPFCYTKTTCQATASLLYQNNLSDHCLSVIPKQPARPLPFCCDTDIKVVINTIDNRTYWYPICNTSPCPIARAALCPIYYSFVCSIHRKQAKAFRVFKVFLKMN